MISIKHLLKLANQQSIKYRMITLAVKWFKKNSENNIAIKMFIEEDIKTYKNFDKILTPYDIIMEHQ